MADIVISTDALQAIRQWANHTARKREWGSTPNIVLRQAISPAEMRPMIQASVGSVSQIFWADSGVEIGSL